MLTYIKWSFFIIIGTLVAAFLHYTLPQWTTVRITDTYNRQMDVGVSPWFWSGAAQTAMGTTRDVFFVVGRKENGRTMEFRNEDTGWWWPPYFKFDTSSQQTVATDLISSQDNPRWVAVRHYGWRSELFTIYPNTLRFVEVDGPNDGRFPWVSLIILIGLGCVYWFVAARIRRFRKRRIDPLLD